MDILEQSLKKAFIDRNLEGSYYDPKMIINNPPKREFLLNTLQTELNECQTFFFSVAFVTQSGLNAIKTQLADLKAKGVKGQLLTSTYLYFNQPCVFRSLLNIPNLEVKISEKTGFHAKGYLFSKKDYHAFIIGSSNLTMNALKINYEWNIRLTSYEQGEVIQQIQNHMHDEWQLATPLTEEWVQSYEKDYQKQAPRTPQVETPQAITDKNDTYIQPNKMQRAALDSLKALREQHKQKGLIVSATGTGKTYLAALDVLTVKPKRLLFIVHREQILEKAKESFQNVIRGNKTDYGILSGNHKDVDAKYLFATIQTLAKEAIQTQFAPDAFDYILVDEVHKAGAATYQKVLDYFKPQFLLGMTATPERTDGFNIFKLFDYQIAYEIRLKDALEEDLLCPFHYFGVTDYEAEGQLISDTTALKYLTDDQRVNFLIEKMNYYGCSGMIPKGLVFCSRTDEAEKLSQCFNQKGIAAISLNAKNSISEREDGIAKLENGEINYIFTVDIFNEGIDIPKINQVVMLRNTQSNIIFIQQLGRGLRKDPSKEFVTIIDFIGNYKNNYMIPMALAEDISRNKNNLRKDTFDTNYIAGLSAVNFEQIAKEKIFLSIDQAKLDSMTELKNSYQNLKNRLNRVPKLLDFYKNKVLDPFILANKFGSYATFLEKIKENRGQLTASENNFLGFVSKELLPGMRRQELVLLQQILSSSQSAISRREMKTLFSTYKLEATEAMLDAVLSVLSLEFYTGTLRKTYSGAAFLQTDGTLTPTFIAAKNNPYFVDQLQDLLATALAMAENYDRNEPLTLYQKYRRRDVLRLLKWNEQMVDQNIGGYTSRDNQMVIFVTLDKGTDFKGALIAYEDELIDEKTVRWFTKAPRTLQSPEVTLLQKDTTQTHFFLKKKDDHGVDFYYLGKVTPIPATIKQLEKPTHDGQKKNIVEMDLRFETPIENKLFHFLTE